MHHRSHVRTVILFAMLAGIASALAAGGRREVAPVPDETDQPAPAPAPAASRPETQESEQQAVPDQSSSPDRLSLPGVIPIDRAAWIVFFHEFGPEIGNEINTTIERGYVPAAIEVNPGGSMTAIYIYSPETTPDEWLLEELSDPEVINETITARIAEGWVPLGFSVEGSTFHVLFALADTVTISGWRIHQSAVDETAVAETLALYQSQGFGLVDWSVDQVNDRVWYLFIRQPGAFAGRGARFFIDAYPNGEPTVAGILEAYEAGRGFPYAIGSGAAVSLVLYVRPAR